MTDSRPTVHPGGMALVVSEPPLGGRPARRSFATTTMGTVAPPFDEVYEAWFDYVFRTVRRLGVADAAVDDVVQEIFVVVHRRLPDFEGRSKLKTWLFGITFRVVREHRRATARRARGSGPRVDDLELPSPRPGPGEAAERAQAARLVRALLDELDDDKREVFVLAELEGMTAPEIAEITGAKLNTVYSRLRAARGLFERALRRRHRGDPAPGPGTSQPVGGRP